MTDQPFSRDLTKTTLGLLALALLIGACCWIVRPFAPSLLWATMIVVSTWPMLPRLQARLWGRRGLAVSAITVGMILLFVVPFTAALATIVDNTDRITGWMNSLQQSGLPAPPDWVSGVPLVGKKLAKYWQETAAAGPSGLMARVEPYLGTLLAWFAAEVGGVGKMVVQFFLTVLISAILYMRGEEAARAVRLFFRRLAGERGEEAVILASRAIRGVALGVVVTAIVQSLLGGLGLLLVGIPAASILSAVMFILCLAQVGPTLVLLPCVIWLYWSGQNGTGSILLVWSIAVGSLDNIMRPALIKKGVDLPLLLIFTGVLGGLMAFGIVGIFIGPAVLAVSYTLLSSWIHEADPPDVAGS
jgi:predicted PurR-regulated permease PerM